MSISVNPCSPQKSQGLKRIQDETIVDARSKPLKPLIDTPLNTLLHSQSNSCTFCQKSDASTINCSFRRCSVYFHLSCSEKANLILSSEKMMLLGEILPTKSFVEEPVFCLFHVKQKYQQLKSTDACHAHQFYQNFLQYMLPQQEKINFLPSFNQLNKSQRERLSSSIKIKLFEKLHIIRINYLEENDRRVNNIYYDLNIDLSVILFNRSVDVSDLNEFDKFLWAFMVINGLLDKKEFIKPEPALKLFGKLVKEFKLDQQKVKVRKFIIMMRQNYLTKRNRSIDKHIYQQAIMNLASKEVSNTILID